MATAEWTFEDDDKGWVVKVEVEATVVPYVPATRETPPEGGYLEDEEFRVVGFSLEVGNHIHDVKLTPLLAQALALEAKKAYDADRDLRDEVYRLFEE